MTSWQIIQGDVRERLRALEPASVQTCVTSPPYWGLRDYGTEAQLGLEPTPEAYVANLVAVFREVRRVLRDDGTVWLNIGDSYANPGHYKGNPGDHGTIGRPRQADEERTSDRYGKSGDGLKNKDLCGIPWRVAFALQADGWWLRSDVIWSKPNPMPESVTDRPTRSHEYLFLMTKSARYFYDSDAIREEALCPDGPNAPDAIASPHGQGFTAGRSNGASSAGRNKRSVWTVATSPYPDAHFATFPPKLIEPCILAGTPPKCCGECGAPWERIVERKAPPDYDGGKAAVLRATGAAKHRSAMGPSGNGLGVRPVQTLGGEFACAHDDDSGRSVVLDPFAGAGTTGVVALRHDRSFVGIELNAEYCEMARDRIRDDAPLFNVQAEAVS